MIERLAYEWKRAGHAQIALDHFELVVLKSTKLRTNIKKKKREKEREEMSKNCKFMFYISESTLAMS